MNIIYCVEDDQSIRELIVYTLKIAGFDAYGFEDGKAFFGALADRIPDLIMLDIMLPDMSGLEILGKLKNDSNYSDIPVIMETAKTTEFDRVIGLDSGADDYLSKPFGMLEMVSRVQAVLRRNRRNVVGESEPKLSYHGISMNLLTREVTVEGNSVDLTPKEYDLLQCFLENPGHVLSRNQLLERVWGSDYLGESRTIDVHIGTLRGKLGKTGDMIRTIHGIGYSLKEDRNG